MTPSPTCFGSCWCWASSAWPGSLSLRWAQGDNMTTFEAGIVAFVVTIIWAIIMLLLLRWPAAGAAQASLHRRRSDEDGAGPRSGGGWPAGQQRQAQSAAVSEQERQAAAAAATAEWYERYAQPAKQPAMDLDAWWRRVEPIHPYETAPVRPSPVQPAPSYAPAPAQPQPIRTQPVAQPQPAPVPVQPPGIAVLDWPMRTRQTQEQRKEVQP